MRRLVINGDEIYEVDEECLCKKNQKNEQKKKTHNQTSKIEVKKYRRKNT